MTIKGCKYPEFVKYLLTCLDSSWILPKRSSCSWGQVIYFMQCHIIAPCPKHALERKHYGTEGKETQGFYKGTTYLQMKPPLSHFLLASVFSGKSSSGLCRTSTSTDNSAWTRGRNRSSNADTISWNKTAFRFYSQIGKLETPMKPSLLKKKKNPIDYKNVTICLRLLFN